MRPWRTSTTSYIGPQDGYSGIVKTTLTQRISGIYASNLKQAHAQIERSDARLNRVGRLLSPGAGRQGGRSLAFSDLHGALATHDTHNWRAQVTTVSVQSAVDEIIKGRYSCRAFLDRPVAREVVEDILSVASHAPSGTNIQPWKAWVLTGETKKRVSERMLAAFDDPEELSTHTEPYQYYPKKWVSPYIERRRKVGFALYGLLGIQKGDAQRMHDQYGRNYTFFDAPVGLIFTVDTVMEQGSWLDYGMFMQNVMLAAKARGLDTCPQAALIQFHRIIREEVGIPDSESVICGMSLGYGDPDAPENALRTERAPLDEWVQFRD